MVARDAHARLEPRHADRARRTVEDAERRLAALAEAVNAAVDDLLSVATAEHEQIAEAARAVRDRSAEQVRVAATRMVAAVEALESMLSAARWSAEPDNRHWRLALGRLPIGKGNAAVDLGVLLGALAQLPDPLLDQRLPDEVEPEPGVKVRVAARGGGHAGHAGTVGVG